VVARKHNGSTVHRRQLGRMLKEARLQSGVSISDAAAAIQRSNSTVFRIEGGDGPTRGPEVYVLCQTYGLSVQMTEALVAVARETTSRGWWAPHRDVIPEWFNLYLGMEQSASEFRWYEAEVVPGTFQVEDYTRAIIADSYPNIDQSDMHARIAVRQQRQALLLRDISPPTIRAVINEAVVRRPVGGRRVMAAQCLRLAQLSTLPNIELRVLPFSAGLHAGVMTGPFTILSFPAPESGRPSDPPTVYVEGYVGALYLDQEDEVMRYDQAFDRISAATGDPSGDKTREILWKASQEADA